MSIKREKIYSYLIYNIVSLFKMAVKADGFKLLRKSAAILNDVK